MAPVTSVIGMQFSSYALAHRSSTAVRGWRAVIARYSEDVRVGENLRSDDEHLTRQSTRYARQPLAAIGRRARRLSYVEPLAARKHSPSGSAGPVAGLVSDGRESISLFGNERGGQLRVIIGER